MENMNCEEKQHCIDKIVGDLLDRVVATYTQYTVPDKDITFTITENEVVVEFPGKPTERLWLPDFFDALPNGPQRGTAVIETIYYGRLETECAIHTYEISDPYTGEYDDQIHFIPLEVYLRELVSQEDMKTAYKTLKSLTA